MLKTRKLCEMQKTIPPQFAKCAVLTVCPYRVIASELCWPLRPAPKTCEFYLFCLCWSVSARHLLVTLALALMIRDMGVFRAFRRPMMAGCGKGAFRGPGGAMARLLAMKQSGLKQIGSLRVCCAVLAAMAAFLVLAPNSSAAHDVLLTLSSPHHAGVDPIALTRDDLAAMPQRKLRTATEWTDGRPTFEGPLARDVVAMMDGHGEKFVNAIAVNDYSVEIPLEDFRKYDVILALSMDGRELSLRDKGPIWIVYPRDDHKELHDPVFNSRWIWQLDRLELR